MFKLFRRKCLLVWLVVVIAITSTPVFAEEEYNVKAAFIANFTKFVEWPVDKAINKQTKIDICVLGDSEIINASELFRQASTKNLSISLVKEKNLANISSHCHIVFVSASEASRLEEILTTLKKQPVLTIGDYPEFVENGGMMGFVLSDNRIRFIVNKKAVELAGLRVDSQLLEIALKVIDR